MDFGFFETRKDYFDLDNSFILVHHQGKEMLVLLSDLLTHRIIEVIVKGIVNIQISLLNILFQILKILAIIFVVMIVFKC